MSDRQQDVSPTVEYGGFPETMRLSVPYNHDPALLDELEPFAAYIDNVYLAYHPSIAWSGRSWRGPDVDVYRDRVEQIAHRLQAWSVGITFVANLTGLPIDEAALVEETNRIASVAHKVRVTFAELELARRVAPDLNNVTVCVSTLATVATARDAWLWKNVAGAQHVTVARHVNRRPDVLRAISDVGLTIGVVTCDGCVPRCPSRAWHVAAELLDDGREPKWVFRSRRECCPSSWSLRRKTPWVIACKEVLPGHLRHLAGIVDEVKLPGRDEATEDIVDLVRLYLDANSLRHPAAGYIEPMEAWDKIAACDRHCSDCMWCAKHLEWEELSMEQPAIEHDDQGTDATLTIVATSREHLWEPSYDPSGQLARATNGGGNVNDSWSFLGPGGLLVRIHCEPSGDHVSIRVIGEQTVGYTVVTGDWDDRVIDLVHQMADLLERVGYQPGRGREVELGEEDWVHGFVPETKD